MPSEDVKAASIETAVLSAVALGDENQFDPAMEKLCGIPLISLQIRDLQELGIKQFLIEAEQLTGGILSLVDELKAQGIDVAMVRAPKDLTASSAMSGKCLVLAPGINVGKTILGGFIDQNESVVATVDGRDENSAFERIDLNTRWAGMAIVDQKLLKGLADLPEGWSLTSAILRSALQSEVKQQLISQQQIDSGALQVIDSNDDAERLKREKLQDAASNQSGLVEMEAYAPLARWLTLRFAIDPKILDVTGTIFALATLLFGFFGVFAAAVFTAILAIFFLTVSDIIFRVTQDRNSRILSVVSWILLVIALLCFGIWTGDARIIFAAPIAGGLLLYSSRLRLKTNMRRYLPSPALLSLSLIAGVVTSQYSVVFQMFVLLQVATLLYVQFTTQKNATELNRP